MSYRPPKNGPRACLITLAVLVLSVTVSAGEESDVELLSGNIRKAKSFIQDHNYRSALPFLNSAIKEGAETRARYLRGRVFLKLNQAERADQEATWLIQNRTDNWRGYELKVRVLQLRGWTPKTSGELLQAASRALEHLSADLQDLRKRLYLVRGRGYVLKEKFSKAHRDFRRAAEKTAEKPDAARAAARAAYLTGNHDFAGRMARAVLKVVPSDLTASRLLFFIEKGGVADLERTLFRVERKLARGRYKEALKQVTRMKTSEPERLHVSMVRGRILFEMGRYREAENEFRNKEKRKPTLQTAFWLGRAIEARNLYGTASRWYLRADRRGENFPRARLRAGICLSRSNQHERAVNVLSDVPDMVQFDREGGRRFIESCLKTGYLVYAQEWLSLLQVKSEYRTKKMDEIYRRLRRRHSEERETFENRIYENHFYGIRFPVPEEWSYSLNPGKPRVLALFVILKSTDRFFITAGRRPPHLNEDSLSTRQGRVRVREYLVRTRMKQESGLRFSFQEPWSQPARPGVHLLFQNQKSTRLHLFVRFHSGWMFTFYYLTRDPNGAQFDRMKTLMKGITIMKTSKHTSSGNGSGGSER